MSLRYLRDMGRATVVRIHLLPLTAVLLWGGVYPGAKLGLLEIPVLPFASLRILIAAVILLALSGQFIRPSIPKGARGQLLAAGLAQTIFQAFFVLSMERTSACNGAILLAVSPLFVVVWQVVRRKEPFRMRSFVGLFVGLLGVCLVASSGASGGSLLNEREMLGNTFALVSALGWAWYSITMGHVVSRIGSLAATGWTMAFATAVVLPPSVSEIVGHPWASVSWVGWLALFYGSVLGPVVGMALWGRALERLGPSQTMVYTYLEPVAAVTLAAIVLHEALGAWQAIGAVLALTGIWLASRRDDPDTDELARADLERQHVAEV